MGVTLLFFVFALFALVTAVLVVASSNPIRAALFLVLNLFCIAALYLLLNAYFLATVQVIVYAGAIMVLFLFVIMLLNLGSPDRTPDRLRLQQPLAIVAAVLLAGVVGWSVFSSVPGHPRPVPESSALSPDMPQPITGDAMGTVEGVGKTLFNPGLPWLFPFEITSVLLLIAVVGSVVLARRSRGGEEDG